MIVAPSVLLADKQNGFPLSRGMTTAEEHFGIATEQEHSGENA
jgi:hypothetical protein